MELFELQQKIRWGLVAAALCEDAMRQDAVYDDISLRELGEIAVDAGFDVEIKVSSRGTKAVVIRSPGCVAVGEIVSPADRERDRAFKFYTFVSQHRADLSDVNE